jgi:outer membrane protein assembly factor BamB
MRSWRSATGGCLLVAFCAVALLTGCGENPASGEQCPYNTGSMFWNIQGMQQPPVKTAWTYVWDQSYKNQIIPCLGTATAGKLYQGGQGLLELDLATGQEVIGVNWTKEHPIYLESSPLLWDDKLYGILSEQKETEVAGVGLLYQRLSCLDAITGKILWQSDEIGTWEKPCGHPLLLEGKIYLAACFPVPPPGKAPEANVHAAVGIWDAKTGTLIHRIPLPNGAFPYFTHLVSDGTSLYGNANYEFAWSRWRSSIFCCDPVTGKMRWSTAYPSTSKDFSNIYTALAVGQGGLVSVFQTQDSCANDHTGTQHRIAASLDTATGHLLWAKTKEIPNTIHTTQMPNVAMQSDIAFFTLRDGTIMAVDNHTGAQKWLFDAGSFAFDGEAPGANINWYLNLIPMATRDTVYVQEGVSCLVALNSATGAKLWQKTLLTKEEQESEKRELCDVIPVDKGLVVVTANTSDLRPIVELWK